MASTYDLIGGGPAVAAAVDDLYARILADPELAHYFTETDMRRHRVYVTAFVTGALGGPDRYAGRPMRAAHAGLGITDATFEGVVGHLGAALAGLGVPPATIETIAEALAPLREELVTA